MDNCSRTPWQGHKHTESTDSEISFFDPSSSVASDGWSGYFEGWSDSSSDSFCPQIASASSSPTRSYSSDETPVYDQALLPTACPRRNQTPSMMRVASVQPANKPPTKAKRYGIVPNADSCPGDQAVAELDALLQNSMSNTEDILKAMYNPGWDVASLQKWYQTSARGPSDLALFKIMFSLRYTTTDDGASPIASF